MERTVRVFVSSTWQDLQPERQAVERALQRMQDAGFSGMEYLGSRPDAPRDVCLKEVDCADVYLGIFAHRYGSLDPVSGLSMTEMEYRRARQRDIPCLIYFKDENVPVPPAFVERELDALKDELKANHTLSWFDNPDGLATAVVTDLHNWMVKRGWIAPDTPLPSVIAELHGSGAIAQGPGAKAVGERGVLVEGDVHGAIVTGNRNIVGRAGEEGEP
jgi:hypothetical protein